MSIEDKEIEALSIIIGTKGSKGTNLIKKAEAFQLLYKIYGSVEKVSNTTGIDVSSVHRYLSIHRLPDEVKMLIKEGKIDSYHVAAELNRIEDISRLIETAQKISNIPREEVRDIIRFILMNPALSVDTCINQILRSYEDNSTAYVYIFEPSDYPDYHLEGALREKAVEILQKAFKDSRIFVKFFNDNLVVVLDKITIKKLGLKPDKNYVKEYILNKLKK